MKHDRARDFADLIGGDDIPGNDDALNLPGTMRTKELAALLGISERNVDMLVTKNVLVKIARGRFNTRDSIAAYCGYARRAKGNIELDAEKLRLVSEQADREALRNSAARGELVSSVEVERRWTGILRQVRSALLAVPSRVSGRAGHLTGADLEIIDREIRDALQELSSHDDDT